VNSCLDDGVQVILIAKDYEDSGKKSQRGFLLKTRPAYENITLEFAVALIA
jgi:hypothetical protein